MSDRADSQHPVLRGLALLVAGVALAWTGWAAGNYPVLPAVAVVITALWTATVLRWPCLWPGVVLALLPALGFASWTGWLAVEEFDLLLGGVAAAGYLRIALTPNEAGTEVGRRIRGPGMSVSLTTVLAMALLAIAAAMGLARGLLAAGTPQLVWTDGYFDALNSVRVGKSLGWCVLLFPVLVDSIRTCGDRVASSATFGQVVGLGVVALGALWERVAFPGLLNFSTDYRTTSVFWEMHVGGAALDGYLALAMPFAVALALGSAQRGAVAVSGAILLLASYAALTTFSRGVYIGVPVGFSVWAMLYLRQLRARGVRPQWVHLAWHAAFAAAIGLGAWLVFREGGYRTLIALLVCLAAFVHLVSGEDRMSGWRRVIVVLGGLLLGTLMAVVSAWIPKGAYVMFVVASGALAVVVATLRFSMPLRSGLAPLATLMAAAMLVLALNIGAHGGGEAALRSAAPVAIVLLLAFLVLARPGAGRLFSGLRAQGAVIGVAVVVAATVAVFSGGAYMGDRFATTKEDLEGRKVHWAMGVSLLHGPIDWLLGRGYGRFPADYFYHLGAAQMPGSYAWKAGEGSGYVSLAGAHYPMSWGDLFRFSQRVGVAPGRYQASFDVRTATEVDMHVEICAKHLLYDDGCAVASANVKPMGGAWQSVQLALDGANLGKGAWYAPRLGFFSLAVASSNRTVDIDNVGVVGPSGQPLIANGDFAQGTKRWFFTSDRHHLPWHIKNLFLNVLFEQGLFGLSTFGLVLTMLLWRLCLADGRDHALAPAIVGGVAGLLAVGVFDSVLDVPRVAWQFYFLLTLGLLLGDSRLARGFGGATRLRARSEGAD